MNKSLLAAGVAIALSGISSSFAADVTINNAGGTITVPLSNFSYDSSTNKLTLTTTATLTKGSGGDTGGGDTGGGDTGGGDTGGGDTGGGDDGGDTGGDNGSCDVAGVFCRNAMPDWPKDTLGLRITIPQGGILSSQFVAGQKAIAGSIDFEAKAQFPYPSTNIWISKTPGGSDIGKGSRLNHCSKEGVSFLYGISWTQGDHRGMCKLTPGETYYLNIEHSNKSTPASTVYRYVK